MHPRIYYVILSAGVPVDVTHIYSMAKMRQVEWDSRDRRAEIVPVVPTQESFDFDFSDEEPTDPYIPFKELIDT